MAKRLFRFSPSEWHARPEVQRLSCAAKGCLIELMWIAEGAKRFGYLEMPNGASLITTPEGGPPYRDLALMIREDLSGVMAEMFDVGALHVDDNGDFFIPWMVDCAEGER